MPPTIAGTASDTSGITLATVNGKPTNETRDWSANIMPIVGENIITVTATDDEGLTTTETVTMRYELLRGDLDHDGMVTSLDALMIMQAAAGAKEL